MPPVDTACQHNFAYFTSPDSMAGCWHLPSTQSALLAGFDHDSPLQQWPFCGTLARLKALLANGLSSVTRHGIPSVPLVILYRRHPV